jgi:hypothetical protein
MPPHSDGLNFLCGKHTTMAAVGPGCVKTFAAL